MNSNNSNFIALQAQQYAASEAELQKKVDYKDLSDVSRSSIVGTDFQQEVLVSAESDYSDTIKQKQVTIKVYNSSENVPRVSLNLTRYSVEQKFNGIPVGTIIAWASSNNPSDGTWLECNGQSCSAYPELVSVLGKNTVPDYRGRFLEGAAVSGILKEAGLPNITGQFGVDSSFASNNGSILFIGVFVYHIDNYTKTGVNASNNGGAYYASFDASRCSSIYGNSNTVQPPAVTVRYFIRAL